MTKPDRIPDPDRNPDSDRIPDSDREPEILPTSRLQRRRDKIAAEIARNRRGEYTVPTWALALILLALLAGWAALVIFS